MKKIGLLMTLASLLVVGGVYATWSYSQGEVAAMSDEYGIVMTAETVKGTKGTFAVNSSSITFEVGNKGEYHPELRGAGEAIVTFSPSVGADTSVLENGIDIKWSLSVCEDGAENWKYDPLFQDNPTELLFTLDSTETTISKTEADSTSQPGRFIYTIDADDILQQITFNVADDFVIDTKAKYDSFKKWLAAYHFVLTVSEA